MKIINRNSLFTTAISLSIFLPVISFAGDVPEITIVNHFTNPLKLIVGINSNVLPDLPGEFTLAPNDQIQTKVVDIKKEAYIDGDAGPGTSVFWGVEVENSQAKFHGYISKEIAYSWNTNTIIFCTPDEYKTKKSCF